MSAPVVDVAVVGAGPAGSAAAIELARTGRSVLLIDKARFPRDKCCGDGLTTGALRHLEHLGFDPTTVASFTVVDDLVVRSPQGRTLAVPLGRRAAVAAAVAPRYELDAALVELAQNAGATTSLGTALVSLRADDDGVQVGLDDGSVIRCAQVVAADGAWSSCRHLVGGATERSRIRSNWTAFRAYVAGVGEEARRHLHVIFTRDVLPGYLWSFPLTANRANVGLYVARDDLGRGHGLKAAWEQARRDPYLLSVLGERARLEGPVRAWPIPASLDTAPSALDGQVLFVGDALGAADPFTGEGIAQALESGRAAAAAISGSSSPQAAAVSYERAIEESLRRDHHVARVMSRGFAHPRLTELALAVTDVPFLRRQIGRFLYEDYPRAALFSPSKWPSTIKPAPGPYAQARKPR